FGMSDAAACIDERFQGGFAGELTVELDQLANFMAAGMIERSLNGGQFVRQQNESLIVEKEAAQRRQIVHDWNLHRNRNIAEGDQSVCAAELFDEGMPVAQPLSRFTQHRLK